MLLLAPLDLFVMAVRLLANGHLRGEPLIPFP